MQENTMHFYFILVKVKNIQKISWLTCKLTKIFLTSIYESTSHKVGDGRKERRDWQMDS